MENTEAARNFAVDLRLSLHQNQDPSALVPTMSTRMRLALISRLIGETSSRIEPTLAQLIPDDAILSLELEDCVSI